MNRRPALFAVSLAVAVSTSGGGVATQMPAASIPRQVTPRFGVGRPASPAEIAAWDKDVNGSGVGLPPGSGTAAAGGILYKSACAACHGLRGEGGAGSQLVKPAAPDVRPRRNIATHWPYAPPLFDYIRRTMPPAAPWSLKDEEVYALVAYLLAENHIVAPDTRIDARILREVQMPARSRFFPDDRTGGKQIK